MNEGAVGRGVAVEFTGFLRIFRSLPSLDGILLNPATAPIPAEHAALCALATGLAHRTTEQNFAAVCQYADRLPGNTARAGQSQRPRARPPLPIKQPSRAGR